MKRFAMAMTALTAISCTVAMGCGGQATPPPLTPPESGDGNDHGGHAHDAGPHDGVIADWGGGTYHVEFTVDHDKQEATVYVLGDDAKTATPIEAAEIQLSIKDPEMQVALKAAPQKEDPEGSASRFIGQHEKLGVVKEYEGTITGLIDGTPYSGDFKEVAHEH